MTSLRDAQVQELIAHNERLLEALRAIATIQDNSSGDRGPIKYARHIAKCAIAQEQRRRGNENRHYNTKQ
jgi:hypothetical protein